MYLKEQAMKAKIFTFLWAGLFFFAFGGVQAQNLLVDGDFSVTTEIPVNDFSDPQGQWISFVNIWNGADAIPTVESGVCRFEVNNGGWDLWEVQLIQAGFPLIVDHTYRLTFDAKSDYERWFGVYLGESGGDWYSIMGANQYYQIMGTEWKTFTLEFVAGKVFPIHKFSLEFGGYGYGNLWFDNFILEDLGKLPIYVGILGTAVDNWDTDVDMATTDEIIYTLEDFPLKSGYCKFRQNDNWVVNWGDSAFPTGVGVQNGPDIPVYTPGTYDISFNRKTGEYAFVCSGPCAPAVGFLGTAVPPDYGWDTDLPMWSVDGVNYKIVNLWLVEGEAAFRLNDDPSQLWGGTGFPDGTATLGGLPIPVVAGHYEVLFNLSTGEYQFIFPQMGILGSALNGWETDIDMVTTDGNVYTLLNQTFTDGSVKFRLDNDWVANWGGFDFPRGSAIWNGPDIPVMAGTYNVTFNILENYYMFEAITCPVPGIRCPDPVYVANDPGVCGAVVWYPDVMPTPNCGGDGITIVQTAGLPSGSLFPVGTTTNSFLLTNEQGLTAECSFDIMVYDIEPPILSDLSVEFDPFSPPNHKMIPITLNYALTDNCGNATCEVFVYSSEPENGIGDGNTLVDTEVIDAYHLLIRAERSGPGEGRYYYILLVYHDESWNSDYRIITLFVPHDNRDKGMTGKKKSAIISLHQEEVSGLHLWPNPSHTSFSLMITGDPDTECRITVSDMAGRSVFNRIATGPQTLRFGEELTPGFYLVRVTRAGVTDVLKAVKE